MSASSASQISSAMRTRSSVRHVRAQPFELCTYGVDYGVTTVYGVLSQRAIVHEEEHHGRLTAEGLPSDPTPDISAREPLGPYSVRAGKNKP